MASNVAHISISLDCDGPDRVPKEWAVLPVPQRQTVPHQAPLSMRFPRQEYWSGLTFPSLGDLSNPGIEPESPALQANALPLSHLGSSSIYHYPHFKYGVSIFDT